MKKIFKICALCLGVFLLLVGIVYLSFHFFLKDKLAEALSRKLQGEVHFSDLDLSIYPKPGIKIKGFEIKKPRYTFRFESCIFLVKVRPLFSRRLEVDRFLFVKPSLIITRTQKKTPPTPKKETEKKAPKFKFPETIFEELRTKTASWPEFHLEIQDGSLSYLVDNKVWGKAYDLEGLLHLKHQFLEFEITGKTPATQEFFWSGRIWPQTEIAEGLLEVRNLHLEKSPYLVQHFAPKALKSDINLKVTYRYEEKGWLLGFNLTSSCLSKPGRKRNMLFECAALLGKARVKPPFFHVDIAKWVMKEPSLKASGYFARNEKGFSFDFRIEEGLWEGIRSRLLDFWPHKKGLRTLCQIIRKGKVRGASFSSRAPRLSQLLDLKNISLRGQVERAEISLSHPPLHLTQLAGTASLKKGLLRVDEGSGFYRQSSFLKGHLLLNLTQLKDLSSPFELRLSVSQGYLADLFTLLQGLPLPSKLEKELAQTKGEGTFKGQVELKGTLKKFSLNFNVQPQQVTLYSKRLPFPLQLYGGKLTYVPKRFSIKGLNLKTPRSELSSVSGGFDFSAQPYLLDLEEIHGEIALAEAYAILTRLPQTASFLETYALKGEKLEILEASYHGPLQGEALLKALSLRLRGQNLLFRCPQLPGPLTLRKGTLAYKGNLTLEFEPSSLQLLDAQALVYGRLSLKPFLLRLEGEGESGEQFVKWVFQKGKLSSRYFPRTPLRFTRFSLNFSPGKIALEGQVARGEHQAFLKLQKNPQNLVLKFDLQAGAPPFSFYLNRTPRYWRFSLQGRLNDQNIKAFLWKNPFLFQALKANFKGYWDEVHPLQSSFTGQLYVLRFKLPWKRYPLWIKELDLEAHKKLLTLKNLEGDLDGLSFQAQGKMELNPTFLNLEGDLYSPRVPLEKVLSHFKKKKRPKKKKHHPKVKVVAKLNLLADAVVYKKFTFSPFEGVLFYHPGQTRVVIKKASLCNINLWGSFTKKGPQKGLTLNFEQLEGDLRHTMTCLFESRLLEGPFWLKGYFKTEGQKLLEKSSGNFRFTSSKGHIYKFGTLAKIFSVLSPLDIFQGNIPDFHKKGTDFNLWKVKGHFEKHFLVVDSWLLEAPGFRVFASGKVNLRKQKLDFTVFVSPFETVDSVVSKVPLVGWILTGKSKTFFAVPVKVSGKIGDPSVTPLSPSAVGGKALGIIKRTLQLPIKIFIPGEKDHPLTAPEEPSPEEKPKLPPEEQIEEIPIEKLPPPAEELPLEKQ